MRNCLQRFAICALAGMQVAPLQALAADQPSFRGPPTLREWEAYVRPQRLVDIGGRRLNLYCLGHGSPTVLLDGGLGDDASSWRLVEVELSKKTKVCSYDRAGYGFSDPGPMPRDAAALANDLDLLLRAAHLKGPYVVVGHSLAGLHIRLFADRHLHEVVGMVLVDPSFEHQVERFDAAIPSYRKSTDAQFRLLRRCIESMKQGMPPRGSKAFHDCVGDPDPSLPKEVVNVAIAQANADHFRTALSELQGLAGSSSDEIDASRHSYGSMPLVVLSSSIPPNADADTLTRMKIWYAMHDRIARLSTHGVSRIVPDSTHHIQDSRPDVVIATIDRVVDEARKN